MPRSRRLRAALIAEALLSVSVAASVHPVCAALFRCGCEPVWAGGAEHCNIHTPGVPHGPWCTRLFPVWLALAAAPGVVAAWIVARRSGSTGHGWVAGLVGYLLGALVSGLVAALLTGYPLPFQGP